jgi:hypothetical protein
MQSPAMRSRPNALLSLPFPLTFRNFISTGLAKAIEARLEHAVHLISPYPGAFFHDSDGSRFPNHPVASHPGPGGVPGLVDVSLLDSMLKSIHLTGFALEYPDGSLQNMTLSRRRNAQWAIAWFLTRIAPRASWRRSLLRTLYGRYRPKKSEVRMAFDRIGPRFVMVASPGHYWLDHFVLDEAKRRNIPVFCIVLSWDNLYSRGPLCRRPDFLMVWSDEMKRQAVEVHRFPARHIDVVGALQFMFYDGHPSREEIERMRQRIGLASGVPYLAYVCGVRTGNYDVEDVLAMRDALQEGPYSGLQIVVRPHPQGTKEAYQRLAPCGILVDGRLDLTATNAPPDHFDREAIRHMAAFLSEAEFVVSSWGTTVLLEACIFDVPAIQLRWMSTIPHTQPQEVQMVRDFQRYIHMRSFDAEGARLYCDGPTELVPLMKTMKQNDCRFALRRKAAVQRLVCTPLGGAVDRICRCISQMRPCR